MKNSRLMLFSPSDSLAAFEAESDDKVRRAVAWLAARRWRAPAFFGRVLQSGHGYFKCLPDLRSLEENLQSSSFDRAKVRAVVDGLKISGLQKFLERMV
jgi:hypothetical protein